MYGCRVVQKLIDVIPENYIKEISQELSQDYLRCIEDQNANHVVQKLIEKLGQNVDKEKLVEIIISNINDLCIHQYACRVVQKIFDFCEENEKIKMFEEINKNLIDLCRDQFGNYVIQHLLDKMGGKNCQQIYQALRGRIYEMSIHKFASNVIEKCLYNGTDEQKTEIINELLNKGDNVHDSLISLVKDKFGNYVVQKMIEYAPEKPRMAMIDHIMNNPELRKKKDAFAKHVINYIEKKGYAVNINNNEINDNYNNQEMDMNNIDYNNVIGNNNIPQEFQFMNNNEFMNQMQGNLGMINNMNNMNEIDFEEGQDNFGQN